MKHLKISAASWLIGSTAFAAAAPRISTAGFYPMDGAGRTVYSMNVAWRFMKADVADAGSSEFDDRKWDVVSLPQGLEYLPIDASGGANYQGPAWYRKHFTPDPRLKGRKLFLNFEAIMGKCEVWVNHRSLQSADRRWSIPRASGRLLSRGFGLQGVWLP